MVSYCTSFPSSVRSRKASVSLTHFNRKCTDEEEGTSVCFDMFVGLSKVYECGDSEKRIVELGKEFEMLPAVPMGDVDGLFHGLIY